MAWYIQTLPRSSDEASPALSPCASIAVGPDCLQVSMYNQPCNHAFSSTSLCFLVFGMFSLLFAKAVYPHSVFFPFTSACNQTTNWSTPVQPLTCSTTASVNQSHALTCPPLLNLLLPDLHMEVKINLSVSPGARIMFYSFVFLMLDVVDSQ